MAPDPVWIDYILAHVASNQIEIRCFACWLAQELKPRTYLEVGVRRGFSMAMVAARCPEVEVYGFDSWVPGYGSVENAGPVFVRAEMRQIGNTMPIHFAEGGSHGTLLAFLGQADASVQQGNTIRAAQECYWLKIRWRAGRGASERNLHHNGLPGSNPGTSCRPRPPGFLTTPASPRH